MLAVSPLTLWHCICMHEAGVSITAPTVGTGTTQCIAPINCFPSWAYTSQRRCITGSPHSRLLQANTEGLIERVAKKQLPLCAGNRRQKGSAVQMKEKMPKGGMPEPTCRTHIQWQSVSWYQVFLLPTRRIFILGLEVSSGDTVLVSCETICWS